ncbi:MAG: hypothetical protein QF921_06485 [Pseudomonadales bacterium]|jgi:hypothetical protein|nr:hypothetical protein [Pseudomonadales bacterium]MDP6469484.1 hypothetical protein [Pseudomonadales bacterium]MDP6827326.1 hypothetical protein [Pseudomonadales bacterium]MDP6971149.1 hypothetical protein [Pseudomonadales bacterium]|tara:strand:- start:5663 stop:6082 length:420 start_codon:yes stop_codon:yes gene_type:complete
MEAAKLLDYYKPKVLALLGRASPLLVGNKDVSALVERIRQDEYSIAAMPPLRDPLPGEDAFWFAISTLDLISSIDDTSVRTDPFVLKMIADLKRIYPRLKRGKSLPRDLEVFWDDDTDDAEGFSVRPFSGGLFEIRVPI